MDKESRVRKQLRGIAIAAIFASGLGFVFYVQNPHLTHASSVTCVANLKQIDGAKLSWRLENQKTAEDEPNWSDLIGKGWWQIKNQPSCPGGGIYSINPLGKQAECSLGATITPPHVLPQ